MENAFSTLLETSLLETLYVTGILIFIGIILGIMERKANFYVQSVLGRKGIMLTAWIGTPIHELGHLIMCYFFRHKVHGFHLFNPKTKSGVLGHVRHSWNRKSLFQNIGNFFIGIGPIFSGTAALILGLYLFLGDSFEMFKNYLELNPYLSSSYTVLNILKLTAELFKSIFSFQNLISANFWIYLILAICISSHIALSKADLRGAWRGIITIFTFILLLNIAALIFNIDLSGFFKEIMALNVYLLAFSMISIFFSLIRLILSALMYNLAKSPLKIA